MIPIFISNMSEDVWSFIDSITDESKKRQELLENSAVADRDLFTSCPHQKFVLVLPKALSSDFLAYYRQLFGNSLETCYHPVNCTGQLSLDILADDQLCRNLVALGHQHHGIALYSYSASSQFYRLYQYLIQEGLEVTIPESPLPKDSWTVNFFGSKSGIHQTCNLLFEDSEVKCAAGMVTDKIPVAVMAAQNIFSKGDGVVIKTNKGHAGAGLLIHKKDDHDLKQKLNTRLLQTELHSDNYWSENPIIIEDYIDADLSIAGGSPSVEYLVEAPGKVKFLYDGGMRLLGSIFQGMEIGHNVIPLKYRLKMIEVGRQVALMYSKNGYRGYFDIDFIVDKQGKMHITESNVRKTGGTHVYTTAVKLFGPNFQQNVYTLSNNAYRYTQSKTLNFSQVQQILKPYLFDSRTGEGLIIISENLLELGMFAFIVFAPTKDRAYAIEQKSLALLHQSVK